MAMICLKNVQLAEDGGKQPQRGGATAERTYGYIDLFKAMGDRLPLEIYPLSKKIVLVGRDPSCDIKIKNARISRQQCEVRVISEGQSFKVCLRNLTSRETTVCNNQNVPTGETITLYHGFRFRLYDTELRYRLYDPINERGELDWNRPIPIAKNAPATVVPEPKLQSAPIPVIKIQPPKEEFHLPSKLRHNYRRQSFPLAENSHPKIDLQKLPRSPSMRSIHAPSNVAEAARQRKTPQEIANNNKNSKNMLGVPLKPIPGSPSAYKRRGSSDFDMRKAVLQRSFRRAFKEKVINGVFTDLNDDRYRRALEDLVILSSAA